MLSEAHKQWGLSEEYKTFYNLNLLTVEQAMSVTKINTPIKTLIIKMGRELNKKE